MARRPRYALERRRLATAGGLVLQGATDRQLHAYRAEDGREAWSFPTQTAVIAPPIAYSISNEEYIAVMAGNGGSYALALPAFKEPGVHINGRVLAFKLDGTSQLPPVVSRVPPPQVPVESFAPAMVEEGQKHYSKLCSGCHGFGTYSGGVVPDLRRSPLILDGKAWNQVVIRGALQDAGMISFRKYLTDIEAESIRAYVSAEAALLKQP